MGSFVAEIEGYIFGQIIETSKEAIQYFTDVLHILQCGDRLYTEETSLIKIGNLSFCQHSSSPIPSHF